MNDYYKRITVQDLWQALRILEGQGRESMLTFCRTKHINDEDIERIEYKSRVANTKEQVEKLAEGIGWNVKQLQGSM